MDPVEILGILSALLALFAFVGNQYHKLSDTSFAYDFINMLSGIGLFIYAYLVGAVPFMITNSVWTIVSGIDVVKYMYKKVARGKSGSV